MTQKRMGVASSSGGVNKVKIAGKHFPVVVDWETFQAELDALRGREKAHTHEGDAIAAARRRLPMVEVDSTLALIGPHGPVTLLGVFEGRRQLIAYYFMWYAGRPAAEQCEGCTLYNGQVRELSFLHSRDVTYATLCQGPFEESVRYRAGIFIIFTHGGSSPALVPVAVWNSQDEAFQLDHNQCLNEIAVHGVSHPGPTSLDLQTAVPLRVEGIDLVLKIGSAVLTEEHGALNFGPRCLAKLDGETEVGEIGAKFSQYGVAGQTLFKGHRTDRGLMRLKHVDYLFREGRWWFRSWKR